MCSQGRFRCRVAVFVVYMSCHIRKLTFGHVLLGKMLTCLPGEDSDAELMYLCSQRKFRCRIAVVIYKLQHQKTYLRICVPRKDSDVEWLYLYYIWGATSENLYTDMCSHIDLDAGLMYLCYIQAAMSGNLPSDMCSERRFRHRISVVIYKLPITAGVS